VPTLEPILLRSGGEVITPSSSPTFQWFGEPSTGRSQLSSYGTDEPSLRHLRLGKDTDVLLRMSQSAAAKAQLA
jgi:hypothetical protein